MDPGKARKVRSDKGTKRNYPDRRKNKSVRLDIEKAIAAGIAVPGSSNTNQTKPQQQQLLPPPQQHPPEHSQAQDQRSLPLSPISTPTPRHSGVASTEHTNSLRPGQPSNVPPAIPVVPQNLQRPATHPLQQQLAAPPAVAAGSIVSPPPLVDSAYETHFIPTADGGLIAYLIPKITAVALATTNGTTGRSNVDSSTGGTGGSLSAQTQAVLLALAAQQHPHLLLQPQLDQLILPVGVSNAALQGHSHPSLLPMLHPAIAAALAGNNATNNNISNIPYASGSAVLPTLGSPGSSLSGPRQRETFIDLTGGDDDGDDPPNENEQDVAPRSPPAEITVGTNALQPQKVDTDERHGGMEESVSSKYSINSNSNDRKRKAMEGLKPELPPEARKGQPIESEPLDRGKDRGKKRAYSLDSSANRGIHNSGSHHEAVLPAIGPSLRQGILQAMNKRNAALTALSEPLDAAEKSAVPRMDTKKSSSTTSTNKRHDATNSVDRVSHHHSKQPNIEHQQKLDSTDTVDDEKSKNQIPLEHIVKLIVGDAPFPKSDIGNILSTSIDLTSGELDIVANMVQMRLREKEAQLRASHTTTSNPDPPENMMARPVERAKSRSEDSSVLIRSIKTIKGQIFEQEKTLVELDTTILQLLSSNGGPGPSSAAVETAQNNVRTILDLKNRIYKVSQQKKRQQRHNKQQQSSLATSVGPEITAGDSSIGMSLPPSLISSNPFFNKKVAYLKREIIELKNELVQEKSHVEANLRAYMRASVYSVNATLKKN